MKHILVFGATGGTGRKVVSEGLERKYTITTFVRNANVSYLHNKHLFVVKGNISDPKQVSNAIQGKDIIISVLGNKTSQAFWKPNTSISEGLKNILEGMKKHKVKRILFVTSFGVSTHIFLPERLFITVVLKNIFADIPAQEKMITESNLDWTIIRPARLTNEPKLGIYRAQINLPINPFSHISRSDVADFLLQSIEDKNTFRKAITLSY